ncbi:MAG: DUF4011 domain-containing protein [Parvimonas sp.]|uniref:DUF4011 domain-containing protein n=1 Tax=Parvimonas sp. TaxID=1944660 RepID=UPI0025D110A7|nr:DUF4011 domain-containing protein [Parvimonas sp.]MCI5996655.1 DUF4011 domain-containing protein [Parvimonas sp.]
MIEQNIDKYRILFESLEVFNYNLYVNSIPLIFSINLENNTSNVIDNSKLEIIFDTDVIGNISISIPNIEANESYTIESFEFNIDKAKLVNINELDKCKVTFKWLVNDVQLSCKFKYFDLEPLNHWTGYKIFPQLLASFVTPNAPEVLNLIPNATKFLEESTGSISFLGYSKDKTFVRKQMAAIYSAIYEQKIAYALPPISFVTGQRIRLPNEVISTKRGTCIDMAILFASLCESVGLHPIIMIIEGHAFVGVWLKETTFPYQIVDNQEDINKLLANGINDIEVLECTYMNDTKVQSFDKAVRQARSYFELNQNLFIAIDVVYSHCSGIRPLPVKTVENGEVTYVDYGINEDAKNVNVSDVDIKEHFLDTDVMEKMDKAKMWSKNLLDLSKRNSLISFRPGANNLQLIISNLSILEDALAKGEAFEICSRPDKWSGSINKKELHDLVSEGELIEKLTTMEFKSKRIRTFLDEETLNYSMKNLYRMAKNSIEENGTNNLYLAVGFMKWIDENSEFRYAPVILLPIDIVRKSKGTYSISLRDEDSQMNITLLEMLRQKFDLNIGGLNPLPLDDSGVDINLVFNSLRRAIELKSGWDILEVASIGIFSFSQFVMWNDINTRLDELATNKVVKGLLNGRFSDYIEDEVDSESIDDAIKSNDIAIASSVDSSQLAAIIEANRGSSFILHGPPGTGKSQTITNMIANAIFHGKSVIFVAEKIAALNVVKDRLEKIGLDDYVLEIHSNKTKKSKVLEKLNKVINSVDTIKASEYNHTAQLLQKIKNEISLPIRELHKVRVFGKSIYELIEENSKYNYVGKKINFDKSSIEKIEEYTLEKWDNNIKFLIKALEYVDGKVSDHPLKEFTSGNYSIQNKKELTNKLDSINRYLKQIESVTNTSRIINTINKFEILEVLYNVVNENNIKTKLDQNLFNKLCDPDMILFFEEIINIKEQYDLSSKDILENFDCKILDIDELSIKKEYLEVSKKFFFRGKQISKVLDKINVFSKSSYKVNENNAIEILNNITSIKSIREELKNKINKVVNEFPIVIDYLNIDPLEDLYKLENSIKIYREKYNATNAEIFEIYIELIDMMEHDVQKLTEVINSFNNFKSDFFEIDKEFLIDISDIKQSGEISKLSEATNRWLNNIDKWKDWSNLCQVFSDFKKEGIYCVVEALLNNDISQDKIYEHYKSSLTNELINYETIKIDALSRFNGRTFEDLIERYNMYLKEYEYACKKEIILRSQKRKPDVRLVNDQEAKEIAFLTKAISSKGRLCSIRELFNNTKHIITKYCPIFLMSPISVAQYIDPSYPKFDLVIFDEASQIQTSTAVGAMSRAKDCVIVGDPKQLPPTTFFNSRISDEDNIMFEDMESLLEDCLAINMPSKYLNWHYRSQSESLISFSNSMYYDGRMNTFPSPKDMESKVSLVKLNGVYDRGTSRTNLVEAKAIIDEIEDRILNKKQYDSIGVITFNTQQQDLIDDLLQEKFRKNPNFEKESKKLKEEIFIKNLENVQGDERDIILFSICFAKDQDGKMSMNFGPLNRKGGWRRLNVAITRARREMVIFSSINHEDIDIRRTSSEGMIGIKKFIEFAKKGNLPKSLFISDSKKQSAIIDSIVERINKLGFECEKNFGNSNLKIDIVVKSKKDYLLAIVIDGENYFKIKNVRDRCSLKPSILKSLGWKIINIWSVDYFENPDREFEKIQAYLSNFEDYKFEEKTEAITENLDFKEKGNDVISDNNKNVEGNLINELVRNKDYFKDIFYEDINKNKDELLKINSFDNDLNSTIASSKTIFEEDDNSKLIEVFDVKYEKYYNNFSADDVSIENYKIISEEVSKIIKAEAPISVNLLYDRLSEIFGNIRLTKRIISIFDFSISKVKSYKTKEHNETIYWNSSEEFRNYNKYRLPSDLYKREIYKISQEEISNLITFIVYNSDAISEQELLKRTAELLGSNRLTDKIRSYLKPAISRAIRSKKISREGDILISKKEK